MRHGSLNLIICYVIGYGIFFKMNNVCLCVSPAFLLFATPITEITSEHIVEESCQVWHSSLI